jgi:threonine dehydrogenase-like Zn-dependent dehydrogenase
MRALIHDDKGVRLDARRAAPQAGDGDALVRLKQAAISRDDLNLAARSPGSHGMMGTKFVGVVESVNDRHANLVNKRVVGSPLIYCGVCDLCAAGLRRHCRDRAIFGMDGVRGCLADRFVIPARNLLVVPEGVDDDHAVFAADVASALHAAEQLTIVGKPYITVLGDSSLAMLTAQVMVRLNASVRLIGSHDEHLAMCERWGVKHRSAWAQCVARARRPGLFASASTFNVCRPALGRHGLTLRRTKRSSSM